MKFKATGIVRKIDDLGRVVIPMELRRTLGIKEFDPLEIFTSDGGAIVIRPYRPGCICCGESESLSDIDGTSLCPSCIRKFVATLPAGEK